MFDISRYSAAHEQSWNDYVTRAKNGTFLFNRSYMDYHKDRFTDHSLLFYKHNKLYALLPAHVQGDTMYSHFGLTYGGLIMDNHVTSADVLTLFGHLNDYLRANGIKRMVYRPTPFIYHLTPAEEDLYALFCICNARLTGRNLSTVIDMSHALKWRRIRLAGVKQCQRDQIEVVQSEDYRAFWQILTDNLLAKYQAQPVHTLQEMELLHGCFPENIKLFTAQRQQQILGGVVVYTTHQTVHVQYISASAEGKQQRVLDAVFHHLIHHEYSNYRYFDFGKSTEQDGRYLNQSLIYQKEGFGGRGVCYDTYEWNI